MADPNFPLLPPIFENPITPEVQKFIMDKAALLYPQRPGDQPEYQLSQIFTIFRDGFILPFSALKLDGTPIAKNYDLPVALGTVTASTQVTFVSTITAGGVAASGWMRLGSTHYCTGG